VVTALPFDRGELEVVARNHDAWIMRGTDYIHDLEVIRSQNQASGCCWP